MTLVTSPVRVRFVGAEGQFNSVATQAVRVHKGLVALQDSRVQSDLMLIPADTFKVSKVKALLHRPGKTDELCRLIEGVDILVIVKSSLLQGFRLVAAELQDLCRLHNVILVSSPADGVEADGLGRRDVFSEQLADYVFTIAKVQHDLLVERRGEDTVRFVGTATRPSVGAQLDVRQSVKTVIWENPPHEDPFTRAELNGTSRERHKEFERFISGICERHGARLMTFGFWRDQQDDHDWEQTLLAGDVAIECKSLDKQYTSYQLQKPPVKLQNYLALGMPTICDSLPGHLDVGRDAGVLFADTFEEWEKALESLFASRELRLKMSEAGRTAVQAWSIEAVATKYIENFLEMRSMAGVK